MAEHGAAEAEEKRVPLLLGGGEEGLEAQGSVVAKAWGESKKLWRIAGLAIFTWMTSYAMTIVMQAFAGHLGYLELASMSIATTLAGFRFGLMEIGIIAVILGIFLNREMIQRRLLVVEWGLLGAALALGFSWWLQLLGQLVFVVSGGCPADLAWFLPPGLIAADALLICLNINNWELMIPFAFLGGTGVRVANELGASNNRGTKLVTVVVAVTSGVIGLFFCCMIVVLHDKFALLFTSSALVLQAMDKLSLLLAVISLLNSIQLVLSGCIRVLLFFC